MATYLLTWNPQKWPWHDLEQVAQQVKAGKVVQRRWSCGRSKKLRAGDRVFFLRQGEDPKGIFASGQVEVGSYEQLHWDEKKARQGVTSQFVEVSFDRFLEPKKDGVLPRALLKGDPRFSRMHWDTQISGIGIPDEIVRELEDEWKLFGERDLE